MSENDKTVISNMLLHGRSFFQALAFACERADPENLRRLREAFAAEWFKYSVPPDQDIGRVAGERAAVLEQANKVQSALGYLRMGEHTIAQGILEQVEAELRKGAA